jgi:hypothetical protein
MKEHLFLPQAATGTYVYDCDGEPSVREPWRIDVAADGTQLIQATRDASQFGVHLTLQATRTASGDLTAQFELRHDEAGPILKQADYRSHGGLVWYRDLGAQPWRTACKQQAHFFPLMRCCSADMVRALQMGGGQMQVVVPSIATLSNLDSVFEPLESLRHVSPVDRDGLVFDLSGGAYEAPARLTLNSHGFPAHYRFTDPAGATWDCQLEDFSSV